VPAADIAAGLQGLAAVAMALYARERNGRGEYIDISMQEALVGAILNICGPALLERRQPTAAHGRSTGGSAFYNIYNTADGRQVVLAGQELKFVEALLKHLDRADLIALCARGPGPHQAPVVQFLRDTFARMTHAEAAALFTKLDLCWGTVNSLVEALDDPHLIARGFILVDEAGRRHIGPPIRYKNDPARPNLQAPALNAHADLASGWPRRS
jgi:crotonobetainyl-CoA:carnitine CoA-transferase CaiB-like acyl-CoA transferase